MAFTQIVIFFAQLMQYTHSFLSIFLTLHSRHLIKRHWLELLEVQKYPDSFVVSCKMDYLMGEIICHKGPSLTLLRKRLKTWFAIS